MAVHANSLANLRPARRGDVRNPLGINGVTKDAARRAKFAAVCLALEACEDQEHGERLLGRIFEDIFDGAIAGDSLLLRRLFRFLLLGDLAPVRLAFSAEISGTRRRLRYRARLALLRTLRSPRALQDLEIGWLFRIRHYTSRGLDPPPLNCSRVTLTTPARFHVPFGLEIGPALPPATPAGVSSGPGRVQHETYEPGGSGRK